MDKYATKYIPEVASDINSIIDIVVAKDSSVTAFKELSNPPRVKGISSLTGKIKPKNKQVGESTDLIGGRIVVNSYADIQKVMKEVEQYYGKDRILEITNKFFSPDGKSAYRAVHYIIKLDANTCFELQIKTLPELIFGEIDHDVVYKDFYKLDKGSKDNITGKYWGVQQKELKEYKHVRGINN